MAYADLLDNESIESQYLVLIEPKYVIKSSAWETITELPPGTFQVKAPFTRGKIIEFNEGGASRGAEASDSTLLDGFWYHDLAEGYVYYEFVGSFLPANIVYRMHLSTYDAKFHIDPLDSTTDQVYWEPLITRVPTVKQSSTDDLFGFLPASSTSLSVSNATQFFQEHVYDSSFNNALVKVYHWLDELTVENTKLLFQGFGSNIVFKDNETTIEVFDNRVLFDKEFRHGGSGSEFYETSTFSGLDPDFEQSPVRRVYGVVDKFLPINLDFSEAPTTANNRDWSCLNPHTNLGSVTATVSSSPTSTTTRTYVDDADGLRVGDTVWIDKSTDEYVEITAVDKTSDHYIEHLSLTGGAAAGSDTVNRSFIGSVTIARAGFPPLKLFYKRDYDEYTNSGERIAGFTLNGNFEELYLGANRIADSNAEDGTIGSWAYFDDGTVSFPDNGTGGAQDKLTMTAQTAFVLSGAYSYKVAKAAGDAQGQGISLDFTLDAKDRGKQHRIYFKYKTNEDTYYDDGHFGVWLYDVTNGTLLIGNGLVPSQDEGCNIPDGEGEHEVFFTAATDSTSYRLIFMARTTESLAYDIYLDDILVAPHEAFAVSPTNLSPGTDQVYCRVYGNTNQQTLGGSGFGSDSENTGNLAQGIVILYSLLRRLGLDETEIDTTTFTSLQSSNTDELGFAFPGGQAISTSKSFPTYRDLLAPILQSLLLKFHVNDSGEYSVAQTGPLGASSKTLPVDELLERTFEYRFDYKDIVNSIVVEYAPVDVDAKGNPSNSYSITTATGTTGDRLHGTNRVATFQSLHFSATEAATFASRLLSALQDRKGRLTVKTKHRFFDTELNDVVTVSRPRMPGYAYVAGTDRDREGAVLSTSKGLTEIEVEIDDQKGIEDNTAVW